ncbi:MAG: efflux RND transporter periplasmic adaptor subunit [Anaerolineaceae bacterium]|jgi:HlyD family secretion protein|nr:efflux RND transporter periplasmic adaptor subunit [Anaerolineaceae bacterium]
MKKTFIIILILAVIGTGIYFGVRYAQDNAAKNMASSFQTVTVSRGNLTAIVGATGTVRANQTALVSWQTNGQIDVINYELGDVVKTDAILASLKKLSLSQSIILAEADLITARRNLETLKNSEVAKAQAQANLANLTDALDKAKTRRASKEYKRASQNTIDAAYANYIVAKDYAKEWEQRYDNVDHLPEDDPMRASAFSEWAAAKAKMATAEANWRYAQGLPGENEIEIAEGNLVLAQAQYEDALREWERLKDGPDPDDIAAAEARIAAIEATVDLINLHAPFDGTITEIRSKSGDQIAPGAVSFRIDDFSHLLVDVEIPEIDINRLRVGMPARISFDAISEKEYEGIITQVAQVANITAGIVNFTVTLELTNADELVRPGMTAAVNIIVSEIEDVLVIPNRAVRLLDGQRVVYLLKPGETVPNPVNITIGSTSDLQSEVIEGNIKEGDVIVLNPPTEFMPQGGPFGGGF